MSAIACAIGVAAVGSAVVSSRGQKSAAKSQKRAARGAQAWEETAYYQTREDMAPWMEAGKEAVNQLMGRLGLEKYDRPMTEEEYKKSLDPDQLSIYERAKKKTGLPFEELVEYQKTHKTRRQPDLPPITTMDWKQIEGVYGGPSFEQYEKSPYYNFLLEEGTKGLERGASARGMLKSGAEQKALTEYGQKLASTDYQTWLNDWYKSLTPLQSLAGLGQTTAQQTSALGTYQAGQIGQNILAGGQARAAGQLGQANTWGNVLGWGGQQLGNYAMYNALNRPSYQPMGFQGTQYGPYGDALYNYRF